MARSLNKAVLIGNLTRDPELRYTPQGNAVCTFGLATNRQWKTDSGDKKEDAEFHHIVSWNKLAELCSQLLSKGRKVYVEGRLQTRNWTTQDGQPRTTTEIVISDMIILDSRRTTSDNVDISVSAVEGIDNQKDEKLAVDAEVSEKESKKEKSSEEAKSKETKPSPKKKTEAKSSEKTKGKSSKKNQDEVGDIPEDIPF